MYARVVIAPCLFFLCVSNSCFSLGNRLFVGRPVFFILVLVAFVCAGVSGMRNALTAELLVQVLVLRDLQ